MVGFSYSSKYKTKVEVTDSDKHSRLLQNPKQCKTFYRTDPEGEVWNQPIQRGVQKLTRDNLKLVWAEFSIIS
jgi:hypothetical protein